MSNEQRNTQALADCTGQLVRSTPALPAAAVMWWDGGERAITAREKALIEEHRPSCFCIPLVPASGPAGADPVAWLVTWRDVIATSGEAVERRTLLLHNAVGDFRTIDPAATVTPLYRSPPAQAVDLSMPIAMVDQALRYLSTALDDLDSSPDRRPGVMVTAAMDCLRVALTGVPRG